MPEGTQYDTLTALRIRVQDRINAEDHEGVLGCADELRASDPEMWATFWAVVCALSAKRLDRPVKARSLLEEAIEGGCSQPGMFEPELSELFGSEPDWPELLARMLANVPPPSLELLDWPRPRAGLPLQLDRLTPEREEVLRERLPEPRESSWETALDLLRWATTRWEHGHNKTGVGFDAVKLLDAAEEGQRFRCSEYTVLLTQALNAVGIPARRVGIRMANYHTGVGTGHMMSEAWIDELGAWVILDGQNGLYWHDEDGTPLGLVELLARRHAGEPAPGHTAYSPQFAPEDAAMWWTLYDTASVGRTQVTRGGFAPYLEGTLVLRCDWITEDTADLYPDLSHVDVGVAEVDGRAALRLHSRHPYVVGYVADRVELDERGAYVLPSGVVGEHVITVRARTRYGVVPADNRVVYRIN